jgi:hypothetical protein
MAVGLAFGLAPLIPFSAFEAKSHGNYLFHSQ